jgi:hypothetical protein
MYMRSMSTRRGLTWRVRREVQYLAELGRSRLGLVKRPADRRRTLPSALDRSGT